MHGTIQYEVAESLCSYGQQRRRTMWGSLALFVCGVLVTIVVSRYYFRRSIGKSLVPYIQFSSSPLAGMDPNVRSDVEILYRGQPIQHLHEIQFLIANTGDTAIRGVIDPLTLAVPENCSLLDASLLHVSPSGRRVSTSVSEDGRQITIDFPLLNGGEFFIVKLLLDGRPRPEEFQFTIAAEDLPPDLAPSYLPPDAIGTVEKKRFQWGPLVAGVVLFFVGSCVAATIIFGLSAFPNFDLSNPVRFVLDMTPANWALLVCVVPAIIFLLLGALIASSAFSDGSFPPPRVRFLVPGDNRMLRAGRPFMYRSVDAEPHDAKAGINA